MVEPEPIASSSFGAPKRALSQNFLKDRSIAAGIVDAVCPEDFDGVIEIGPGRGALTVLLAERSRRLVAVELDGDLAGALASLLAPYGRRAEVMNADFLALDLDAVLSGGEWAAVGNIPYAITTPILLKLLDHRQRLGRIVLMVQREVGDRWAAPPGGRACGAISVWCQYCCRVERIRRVRAGAFIPPPKVESSVLRLVPRRDPEPKAADETFLQQVVRAAFHQRRKRAVTSIADQAPMNTSRKAMEAAFVELGLDPAMRAEQIPVDDYVRLANALIVRRGEAMDG